MQKNKKKKPPPPPPMWVGIAKYLYESFSNYCLRRSRKNYKNLAQVTNLSNSGDCRKYKLKRNDWLDTGHA